MMRARRAGAAFGTGLMATALSVALVASAGPAAATRPAPAAAVPGWRLVSSHHFGAAGSLNVLLAPVATGRDNAWAFGGLVSSKPGSGFPVAERWNGRSWQVAPLLPGLSGPIGAASAPRANDVWAVGVTGGYALHYDGTRWAVAKRWKEPRGLPRALTGVIAFSPADVWVFGGPGGGAGLGTWHLHGRTWTSITGMAGTIDTASALSPSNIWAVGGNPSAAQGIVMHYNGSAWRQVRSTALNGLELADILALSPGNVWVLGLPAGGAPGPAVLVHMKGTTWTRVKIPWPVVPIRGAPDGSGGLWLAGLGTSSGRWWGLHLSGAGTWQRYLIPGAALALGLAHIPGTTSLWSTGATVTRNGLGAAIWAYGPIG